MDKQVRGQSRKQEQEVYSGPAQPLSTEQPVKTLRQAQGFSRDNTCQLYLGQGEGCAPPTSGSRL